VTTELDVTSPLFAIFSCGHGGHIQHIGQWLANNDTCPTGCGHSCEYE